IEKSTDAFVLSAADGTTLYLSPAAEKIFGCHPTLLLGKKAIDLVHPDDQAELRHVLTSLVECPSESVSTEFRIRHTDGTDRWVEASAQNLLDHPDVGAIVGNFRDITEQRRAQQMNARLASIVEFSDDAIMGSELDGTVRSWNRGAQRLY